MIPVHSGSFGSRAMGDNYRFLIITYYWYYVLFEGSTSTFVQQEYVSVDFILGIIKISKRMSC